MLAFGATFRCILCNLSGYWVGSSFFCFLNFLVKISDNLSSAVIVSSPMVVKGTFGMWMFQSICHILGGHEDAIIGRHLRHGRIARKTLECIDDSLACQCFNVHILAPIMVHGRAK
jgi:hypothetical protein